MRTNRKMRTHLGDLRRREVDGLVDPGLAAARAPLELAEAQGMVLLRTGVSGWRSRLAEFDDPTNLRIRAGEQWLHPELEEYDVEGVLAFEAGRATVAARLFGS